MKKVIINADDFGISNEVNEAIVLCFKKGYISNTTIMANMPSAQQAIVLAKENGFFKDVGLHLNLREGYPLTEGIANEDMFCDEQGRFEMKINPFKRYFVSSNFIDNKKTKVLNNEIKAQMEWYINAGFTEMHIDSHQSIHTWYYFISVLSANTAAYNFKTMRKRVSEIEDTVLKKWYREFINNKITNPVKKMYDIKTFVEAYSVLPDEDYYEVMCHPIMHKGEAIDSLSGLPINAVTKNKNICLISYNNV